jgi:hypothetical protein
MYRQYLGFGGQNNTYAGGTMQDFNSNTNYNALQVTVQHRATKRLSINANYAWSKALGTCSSEQAVAVSQILTRQVDYGPLGYDRRQYINVDWVFNIPDGAQGFLSNAFGRLLLNGWQLSGITGFSAGSPQTAGYSYQSVASTTLNQEITGSYDISPRGVLLCNPVTSGPHTIQDYINLSCIVPASKGSIGADSGVGAFRGLGYRNWDMAVMKKMYLGKSETRYFQMRFEAYNVFNHTEWSGFNGTPTFNQTTGAITNFQSYVSGQGGGWNGYGALNAVRSPRNVQLGAKFYF